MSQYKCFKYFYIAVFHIYKINIQFFLILVNLTAFFIHIFFKNVLTLQPNHAKVIKVELKIHRNNFFIHLWRKQK
jgi:hypothetical protein